MVCLQENSNEKNNNQQVKCRNGRPRGHRVHCVYRSTHSTNRRKPFIKRKNISKKKRNEEKKSIMRVFHAV